MNAASDYAAAAAALNKPLPAYVAYTEHAHMKFDAIVRDQSSNLVVRTADGAIVKGKPPFANVNFGGHFSNDESIVKNAPFRPSCYQGTSAKSATFDGREVEAIGLRGTCKDSDSDKSDPNKADADFETLYVDPRTHDPVAATAIDNSDSVAVNLIQRYARTGAYVLPSSLYVRVKGSGMMFWLDVLADMNYTNYSFSSKAPS
jgi:hypothetical protein